jgi:hypothetical protein
LADVEAAKKREKEKKGTGTSSKLLSLKEVKLASPSPSPPPIDDKSSESVTLPHLPTCSLPSPMSDRCHTFG